MPAPSAEAPDIPDIPDLLQLEKRYPGIAKAYQRTFDAVRARTLKRASRRCLGTLPDEVKEVSWDTLESFEASADKKRLIRTDIEVIPGAVNQAPFTACLAAAIEADGEFAIAVPEGLDIDAPVLVRNGGIIHLNEDLTPEYIEQELTALRERQSGSSMSPRAIASKLEEDRSLAG